MMLSQYFDENINIRQAIDTTELFGTDNMEFVIIPVVIVLNPRFLEEVALQIG